MIGYGCHESLALHVRGINVFIRRQVRLLIWVKRVIYAFCNLFHVIVREMTELGNLLDFSLFEEAGEDTGKPTEVLIRQVAMGNALKELLQRYYLRPVKLLVVGMLMLSDTHGIHKNEEIFAEGVGRDVAQLLIANGAHTSAPHLGIE